METFFAAAAGGLLDREPAAALRLLAAEVRALHHRMHPADVLLMDLPEGELAIGRHEVPALALLFEHHDVDAETGAAARTRASALIAGARVRRG